MANHYKVFLIQLSAVQMQLTQEAERVHAVEHFSLFRFFCVKTKEMKTKSQMGRKCKMNLPLKSIFELVNILS